MKLVIAAIGGLLVALLLALLHTGPARKRVLGAAQEYLETQQDIELKAGKVDYNLLALKARLTDVSLRARSSGSPTPFLRAESVTVNFDITGLPFGVLIVQDAAVRGLQLRIIQGPGSEGNLPVPPPAEQEEDDESGFQFVIEKLRIPDAFFHFEERGHQAELEIPRWTLGVDGDRSTLIHRLHLETGSDGSLALAQARTALNRILIAAEADAAGANVEEATVETTSSRISLSGRIANWDSLDMDLTAEARIDLDEAGRLAGVDPLPSGAIETTANLSGPAEAPSVNASMNGSGLGWRSLRDLELATDGRWDGELKELTVSTLEAQSAAGSFTASALLAVGDPDRESRLEARLRDISLSSISREAELPVEIASRLSGMVKANWNGLEWKMAAGAVSGHVTSTLDAPEENRLPVSGRFSASGSPSELSIAIHELNAVGSCWNGSATLAEFERLGGAFSASIDTETLNTGLAALFAKGQDWPATAGAAALTLSLDGAIDAPTAALQLTAGDLRVGQLEGVALALNSRYAGDFLSLDNLSLAWRGQELSATGSAGLTEDNRSLAFEATVSDGRIEPVLAGLGIDIPASGSFAINVHVGGTRETPAGTLSLKADELSVYGEEFGEFATIARYEGGVAKLESARLMTPDGGTIEAIGNYVPETNTYAADLRAERMRFDTLTLPDETRVRALLSLTASGSGSLDRPQLDARLSASEIAAGPREFGGLSLRASVNGMTGEARWQAPELSLSGRATTRLSAPYNTDFALETQETDLAALALPGPAGDPVAGRLTARIDGTAPLTDFLSGSVNAVIEQLRLETEGHTLLNTAPIEARLENGAVHLDALALETGDSSLSASGSLPFETARQGVELRLDSELSVADLLGFANLPDDVTAAGRLRLNGSIGGSLRDPVPMLELQLADGSLSHSSLREPLTDINASLAYENGLARLDNLDANLGSASLEVSGEAPVAQGERSAPARLDARLSGLSLQSFSAVPEQVTGRISVRLTGENPALTDWRQLRAELVFDELQLSASGLQLQQQEPSRIRLRKGVAAIESLVLTGPKTHIEATGEANLLEGGTISAGVTGSLDAGVVSLFADGVQADGPVRLRLAAEGPLTSPEATGFVEVQEGSLDYADLDITAENLNIRLDLTPEAVTVSRFSGMLNGGPVSASGRIPLTSNSPDDLRLGLALKDAFFNVPDGFKTQTWATLMVQPREDEYEIGGKITIVDGNYREPLEIQGALASILERSGLESPAQRNPLLEKLNFDIVLETRNPIVLENNLMEVALESQLRITGDYYQPGMTGQLTLQEGGKLYLNERRYFVERGVVTFVSERSIQPDLDVLARTRVSNYDITLRLSGGAEDYSATFTSDPPLPEPDIVSVLLTGRTLEQSRGAELNIAKEQALSYVSGRAASRLSRAAEKSLGISSVRIEPNLVARDSSPGARLTIGQDITDVLRFVYSMNLVDPADQIQILEYDVTKRFLARGTRQQDNSARFDIEHGFQWGGAPIELEEETEPHQDLRIGEVRITGSPVLSEEAVRDNLGLKTGREYSFFKSQKKLDDLRDHYRKNGYLEARVRAGRQINAETVDLELDVTAGPQVEFVFEGMNPPGSVRKRVRRIWENGFADTQRTRESLDALESHLFREDYLKGVARSRIEEPEPGRKRVVFEMEPGIQYGRAELTFPGAEAIAEADLRDLLKDFGHLVKLRNRPDEVAALIERYYRQRGYLAVSAEEPQFEYDDRSRSARIVIAVNEGPAFEVGEITFEGNEAFERKRLLDTAFIQTGAAYDSEWMETWLSRLEELYWSSGYNDVEIEYALQQRDNQMVDVRFRIEEGLQGVVENVSVEGTYDTAKKVARSQVELADGDVLNYRKTIESRRNLYEIGAYSLVDIDPQRMAPDEMGGKVPITMRVKVRERKPFSARYGASYDTERGPGFITDLSVRNKLGAARVLGGRVRYDSEFREARGYVTQPLLFGRHLNTTAAGFRSREIFDTFITDRTGFSIQQQTRPWRKNIFSYGYRFERTDTFDKDPDSIFQVPPFNVAPLQFSWNRESRDEYLNATRGSFLSSGFEWAPSLLGSDVRFVKYVGQLFKYFPLSDPVEVPFGGPPRSRWVYAVGVRAGLGKGLGDQDLIRSERFFAGGSTTLRGFAKDAVGPEDFFGPTGGDATFLTNNEIRFPIFRWIEGVGFLDMGNVYKRVSDFNPTDLRYSSGFGLRVRTPFVLLRVDYGFILDRKPGEPVGGFYFSIGQAF